MLRATILCSLFATTLIPACAASDPGDELAGESANDGESGKGDSAAAFTYFTVTPDLRACSLNSRCGGFFVTRANRTTTTCGRGSTAERCYVDSLDMTGTAMPTSVAKSYEQRLRNGEPLMLRGEIVPAANDAGSTLHVTEIWVPGNANAVADGVFVLVHDNGVRCVRAPCPSLSEKRLNSTRASTISDVDFTLADSTNTIVSRAREQFFDAGVIVVGDRFYPESNARGRTATQFFTRAPVPLH